MVEPSQAMSELCTRKALDWAALGRLVLTLSESAAGETEPGERLIALGHQATAAGAAAGSGMAEVTPGGRG